MLSVFVSDNHSFPNSVIICFSSLNRKIFLTAKLAQWPRRLCRGYLAKGWSYIRCVHLQPVRNNSTSFWRQVLSRVSFWRTISNASQEKSCYAVSSDARESLCDFCFCSLHFQWKTAIITSICDGVMKSYCVGDQARRAKTDHVEISGLGYDVLINVLSELYDWCA